MTDLPAREVESWRMRRRSLLSLSPRSVFRIVLVYYVIVAILLWIDSASVAQIVGYLVIPASICSVIYYWWLRSLPDSDAEEELSFLLSFIQMTAWRYDYYDRQWRGHRVVLRTDFTAAIGNVTIAAGTGGTITGVSFDPKAPFRVQFDGEVHPVSPDLKQLDLKFEAKSTEQAEHTPD